MTNAQPSSHDAAGRQRLFRWAKRPLVLFVVAAALLGTMAIAERDTGASVSGNTIANRRSFAGFSGFSSLFGSGPVSPPASAVALQARGNGNTTPPPNGVVGNVSTPAQALQVAENTASGAVRQAQTAAAAGLAAQQFPSFITAIVCPILFQALATVNTTINALEAAFPFLTAQLEAIRTSAVGVINALLAQFGCVAPSGV